MTERHDHEPGLGQTVHTVAKPMARMAAWAMTATAALALAAAAARTVREG